MQNIYKVLSVHITFQSNYTKYIKEQNEILILQNHPHCLWLSPSYKDFRPANNQESMKTTHNQNMIRNIKPNQFLSNHQTWPPISKPKGIIPKSNPKSLSS